MGGPLGGNEILSLSCSGGEASLMADAAEDLDLTYRSYTVQEADELKEILGEIVTVSNPLDYNTFIWGDWPAMTRMFEAALAPGFDLALLVMDFPREDRCDPLDWKAATDSFVAAVKQTGSRAAVVSSLPETMPESVALDLMAKGIVPLCGLNNAVLAAETATHLARAWQRPAPPPLVCRVAGNSGNGKSALITLDEHQSKTELSRFGMAIPKGRIVSNDADIDSAIEMLQRPFALKALGVAHKSEVNGVYLNLHDRDDITAAMQSMKGLCDRFLLEEMVPKPVAELIVGIQNDPVCGLVLTIGAGGVLTELLNDTVSLLLPTNHDDINQSLVRLNIGKLLDGYRGADPADREALVAGIMSIADFAVANAETLEELDVNPLCALKSGAVAVDALILKRKSS